MKKTMLGLLGITLLMSLSMIAQDTMKQDGKQDSMKSDHASMKAKSVMGKIGDDGKTFTDKDGKSWTINNPDAVKGHEGHQVTVKAHVDADKNEIHVVSLKMAKDMKKDEMHQ